MIKKFVDSMTNKFKSIPLPHATCNILGDKKAIQVTAFCSYFW